MSKVILVGGVLAMVVLGLVVKQVWSSGQEVREATAANR